MANAAITVDLNARIAQFETEMKRATGTLDKFGKNSAAIGGLLKTAFSGAAVVGMVAFAKSGIDAADALNDLSERTGVAVKDLASLDLAAKLSDTSLDAVGKAIQRLNLSVGQAAGGSKEVAASLAALGVTSGDARERLFQLADAYKESGGQGKVLSDVQKVLGKSYTELIPLLIHGGDGLREMSRESESFADSMARLAPNAAKFNDQLDVLRQNAATAVASGLIPLVEALNRVFERYEKIARLSASGASIVEILTGGINANTASGLKNVNSDIAGIEVTLTRLRKNSGGKDQSIIPLEAELARLKSVRAELQVMEAERIMAIKGGGKSAASSFSTPTVTPTKTKTGGSKSDPLASLLGQTDIVKMQEFDKTVALLNKRFDNGRKNTELYGQAMTKLVETTFSANFDEFNKQQAELADIEKDVAAHLKATNDEIYAQEQAWMDAGKALEDEMRTPLENANLEFGRLQDLLDRGAISWETYTRAVLKTQDAIEKTPDKLDEMDVFAKKAAENIQDSFADFLFNPFDKGLDGMLKGFGVMVQRMIAEAVAADLAKSLFGDLVKGGSGDGVAGGLLKTVGSWFEFADGGIAANGRPVALPRFAGGGVSNTAAIFGEKGPEAAVPLPDGRSIPVTMKGGGNTYVVNVNGSNNAPDVRRAAGQGMREALGMMNGAKRYA